ncbi:MAG: T9SS type A sorting domain-containing protein [Sphingobacteriales bacterium]|nr:MAG: T9SS type A sorting domain-containing protein [Sphingobacteriales bacterium]
MKKVLLVLIAAACSIFTAQAQTPSPIPNGGLENWEGTGNNMKPVGWDTLSGKTSRMSQVTYTINGQNKTVMAKQGTYFAAVSTDTFRQDGQLFANPGVAGPRFPYTSRPNYYSMQFGYLTGLSTERFFILINLTKWNTTTDRRDTILTKVAFLNQTGAFEPFRLLSVKLTDDYISTDAPDTASIYFISAGGPQYGIGTTLLIDDMRFSNGDPIGVQETADGSTMKSAVNVYPNPMSQFTNINYSVSERANVKLVITDITGREVSNLVSEIKAAGNYTEKFDRNGLKAGVYLYRLQAGSQVKTGKIIIAD